MFTFIIFISVEVRWEVGLVPTGGTNGGRRGVGTSDGSCFDWSAEVRPYAQAHAHTTFSGTLDMKARGATTTSWCSDVRPASDQRPTSVHQSASPRPVNANMAARSRARDPRTRTDENRRR